MKGVIVLPEFFITRHTDNYKFLFHKMEQELGFDFIYSDYPNLKEYDVVVAYAIPHHNFPDYPLQPFLTVSSSQKLIVFTRDLHCTSIKGNARGLDECLDRQDRMFEKADIILSPYKESFLELFSEYGVKYKWFPQFFADNNRYFPENSVNTNPKPLFLLSGAVHPWYYPLRAKIKELNHQKVIHRHSRWAVGDDYAKMLRRFFGMITAVGKYKMAMAKIFESLAAGQLLLCDRCDDMDALGLVPGRHYIELHADKDLNQQVDFWFKEAKWKYYDDFREDARSFVFKNHGLQNRFELMKNILGEI